jgi:hypothetical protein
VLTFWPYVWQLDPRHTYDEHLVLVIKTGCDSYALPWLSFLWYYGVFHCSVSLRVILVFRDIIYVIIIIYSWHLVICEHFWPYVWNNWSWVMHTMSSWFWHKNRVWQPPVTPSIKAKTKCIPLCMLGSIFTYKATNSEINRITCVYYIESYYKAYYKRSTQRKKVAHHRQMTGDPHT